MKPGTALGGSIMPVLYEYQSSKGYYIPGQIGETFQRLFVVCGNHVNIEYFLFYVSCEIEDFVETHLSRLRITLRSRVLGVSCDLIKDVSH